MKERLEFEKIPSTDKEPFVLKSVHFNQQQDYARSAHFHEYQEFVLFDKADGFVIIDGIQYPLEGTCLVFIPSFLRHEFRLQQPTTHWFLLQFNAGLHQNASHILPNHACVLNNCGQDANVLFGLLDWYLNSALDEKKTDFHHHVLSLIFRWIRQHTTENTVSQKPDENRRHQFDPLLQYLVKNNNYTLSVLQAAKICCIARSTFLRDFKGVFKTTYNQFLLERRMNGAMVLLSDSKHNMTSIASKLEFVDSAYFSKVFRTYTGETPKAFRKKVLGS